MAKLTPSDDTVTVPELAACPCGATPELEERFEHDPSGPDYRVHQVVCPDCGRAGPKVQGCSISYMGALLIQKHRDEARDGWNRRPSIPIDGDLVEQLRSLGFCEDAPVPDDGEVRVFSARGEEDLSQVRGLQKRVSPCRVVNVQLWPSGLHRASHMLHGSENTAPTEFTDLAGLNAAVKTETKRTDNNRYVSWAVEHYEGGHAFATEAAAHIAALSLPNNTGIAEAALAQMERAETISAYRTILNEYKQAKRRGEHNTVEAAAKVDTDQGAESVVVRWLEIDRKADADTQDEGEGCYNIGVRDGFQEAVQTLDVLTGGDGEYRFCTNLDPERHCPDPAFMVRNILRRFNDALTPTPVDQATVERVIENICREVCELPDRTSPDDWPEAMLVTGDELADILRAALEAANAASEPPSVGEQRKPWCSTCGKDVAEVLCPTCAKWWADNPPPSEGEWRPIETAPKGIPTEDVGCRGASVWFRGLHRNGFEVEIHRRPWPQDDGWADREETHYSPESFTHWRPNPPARTEDEQ